MVKVLMANIYICSGLVSNTCPACVVYIIIGDVGGGCWHDCIKPVALVLGGDIRDSAV